MGAEQGGGEKQCKEINPILKKSTVMGMRKKSKKCSCLGNLGLKQEKLCKQRTGPLKEEARVVQTFGQQPEGVTLSPSPFFFF